MTDRICLAGIAACGRHGVYGHEQEQGQRFVVDLVLHVDTTTAGASDSLADTVDYGPVATRVVDIIEGEPVQLIEALAQRIADACLDDPRVGATTVTVHKPQAPIPVPFDDVSVTIERSRA